MKKMPLKKLNPLKFLSIIQERSARFKKASKSRLPKTYPVNALAKKLHPKKQYAKIIAIQNHGKSKTFTFVPDSSRGTNEFAYFAAGQYISVFLQIENLHLTRAYSLSSAPCESLTAKNRFECENYTSIKKYFKSFYNNESMSKNIPKQAFESGFYQITVKPTPNGLVSNWILENWHINSQVELSAPEGNFNYVDLRDAQTVVGIAGGSGITPFLSFAKAICAGDENFNLILLYGSRDKSSILFKNEFELLEKQSYKIKIINVLSGENPESQSDFEYGFITSNIIQKYATKSSYSVFLCGPQAMYSFMDKELEKLNLQKKYIRREMFGEIHNAKSQQDYPGTQLSEISVTVTICDKTKTVKGNPNDTILQILEKNGISVPSRCRSGECGWCHSLLKKGNIFVPKNLDYRRKADLKYNFIHPCCTFALSDLELDIPPAK